MLRSILEYLAPYDHYKKGNGHEHNTQTSVTPEGQQPLLAIASREKGLRIRKHKHRVWHPNVDVCFQENTWWIQQLQQNQMENPCKHLSTEKSYHVL